MPLLSDLPNLSKVLPRLLSQPLLRPTLSNVIATKTGDHQLLLAAPAALALAIEKLNIKSTSTVHVLIVNASPLEFLDDGQWYRFVPALLNRPRLNIKVTSLTASGAGIIGSQQRPSRHTASLSKRAAIQTNVRSGTLHDTLSVADCHYDLAITFAPSLESNNIKSDLSALASARLPFVISSNSTLHSLYQRAQLRAYGAQTHSLIESNPLALITERPGEQWNRVLDCISTDGYPSSDHTTSRAFLRLLEKTIAPEVLSIHRDGDPSYPVEPGFIDPETQCIHTLNGLWIDPNDSSLRCSLQGESVGALNPRYRRIIEFYDPSWDVVDRMIWSANISAAARLQGFHTYQLDAQAC